MLALPTTFRFHARPESRRVRNYEASRCRSLTAAQVDLLTELHLHGTGAKKTNPQRLSDRAEFYLDHGLSFPQVASCLRRDPEFLSRRTERLQKLLTALSDFGFEEDQFKRMAVKYPRTVGARGDNVLAVFDYLHRRIALSKWEFMMIVDWNPGLLSMSVERNISPTCDFFLEEFGLEVDAFRTMNLKCPSLMNCSVEKKVQPTIRFFLEELGVKPESFKKQVKHHPAFFGRSLEKSIKPRVRWLREEMGMDDGDVCRVASSKLGFFTLSIATIRAKTENLSAVLDMDRATCVAFIKRYPTVMELSVENVNAKVSYILNAMGRDREEIVGCPFVLGYSLKTRLQPRHEQMCAAGMPNLDGMKLIRFLRLTEEQFQLFIEKKIYQPRIKFSLEE